MPSILFACSIGLLKHHLPKLARHLSLNSLHLFKKRERAQVTRALAEHLQEWEQQGVWPFLLREKREAFQQEAAAKLAPSNSANARPKTLSLWPLPPASGPASASATCCGGS
jgi:hypothetical protein